MSVLTHLMAVAVLLFSIGGSAVAGTYWVSPTGSSAWVSSDTPLSGENCAALSTANLSAVEGDTIYLRHGTYSTGIAPSNSGTSEQVISFLAYNGETPLVTGNIWAIDIDGVSYIKVEGITVKNVDRLLRLVDGAHYNEISNCSLGPANDVGGHGVLIRDVNGPDYATHNWIHNCTIFGAGWVNSSSCNDEGWLVKVGDDSAGDVGSGHNTFENNVLYNGGHHVVRVSSKYNIFRGNVFYNYGWMDDPGTCTPAYPADTNGKFGNRNLTIVDYNNSSGMLYNLIEGNRIGHAGRPPDDDGSNNLVVFSQGNIIRYNDIYNAGQMGIYLRGDSSDNNTVFNNTIFHNGQNGQDYDDPSGISASYSSSGNRIVNNINYGNYVGDGDWNCIGSSCDINSQNTLRNNWDTVSGDPKFKNTDMSDVTSTTLPDLSLQGDSGARNSGTYLTQAVGGGGTNALMIQVDDALYFQDGSLGSAIDGTDADWIAVGTIENIVQINTINYATNTITLATSVTWENDDPVWLYSKSDGVRVLHGSAPEVGAHEIDESSGPAPRPSAPENLRVVTHLPL